MFKISLPVVHHPLWIRHKSLIENIAGWLIFTVFLIWFYRVPPWMWSTHLPQYGDVVEALWQTDFWRRAIHSGELDLVSFAAMWPIGTHIFSIAHNGVGLLLLLVSIPFGSISAVNLGFILGFVLSFAGFKRLLERLECPPLLASVGGTLINFAFGKSFSNHWHLNIVLSVSLSIWSIVFAISLIQSTDQKHKTVYALLSGVFWGIAIVLQAYFVFLLLIVMLILLRGRDNLKFFLKIAGTAGLISLPYLVLLRQGAEYMSSFPQSLRGISHYSADVLSLVGWRLTAWHELQVLTSHILVDEKVPQNWGVMVWILTCLGVVVLVKERSALKISVLGLLIIAFILSLGPFWVSPPFHAEWIVSVNKAIWHVGELLKPRLFNFRSVDLAEQVIPLPALPLYLFVPYYEMARVPERYTIIVGFAAVIISMNFIKRLPPGWQFFVCALWLLELIPMPTNLLIAPSVPHPAHAWFAQKYTGYTGALSPAGAEWIYSSHLAGVRGTGTIGPFKPAYTFYTVPWINFSHGLYQIDGETLSNPALVDVLVRAQVRIVLLNLEESRAASANTHLRHIQCFEADSPEYDYLRRTTLCAFEVIKSSGDVDINIQPRRGFWPFESRPDAPGQIIWMRDQEAEAGWWLSRLDEHVLEVKLRAFCPRGVGQTADILVNARPAARLQWSAECWEPRAVSISLPSTMLRQGWNSIVIKAANVARPRDHVEGSLDARTLSVAVERLHLRLRQQT